MMPEDIRHARLIKEMEKDFLPEYDASNMPAPEKRSVYALEHIAFRMSRIDQKLDLLIAAITALAAK
jgi:hypothetical protein